MGWWNTYTMGEMAGPADGVSGDAPWDCASEWIDAYVRRFDRAPKRSEVMGAFDAMFHSRARSCEIRGVAITHTGWCDEDYPVEVLDD